jgi:hypothetical protein
MKYLKIIERHFIMGCDEITADDLARVKNHQYDDIINRITEEYFDADKNEWVKIKSTGQ